MSEMPELQTKSRPWQWPLEWWYDEKFWRDVASRAVAGIIVVFVGYAVAVASGLLGFPNPRKVVAVFLVWTACCAVLIALVMVSRKIIAMVQRRAMTTWTSRALLTVWALIYFLLLVTLVTFSVSLSKSAYNYF
ncbi:hypothetical protein [Corynebacterium dentalis]|uniref:hypothetical protein n=1 Tax=Corynebacterium dentalis TaxID=2014528 RepID=UPI0028996412|nr:hypothetical protein [Corynebacterium dentalis]